MIVSFSCSISRSSRTISLALSAAVLWASCSKDLRKERTVGISSSVFSSASWFVNRAVFLLKPTGSVSRALLKTRLRIAFLQFLACHFQVGCGIMVRSHANDKDILLGHISKFIAIRQSGFDGSRLPGRQVYYEFSFFVVSVALCFFFSIKINSSPPSATCFACTVPPWKMMAFFTMASPRPVPPIFRLRPLSTR